MEENSDAYYLVSVKEDSRAFGKKSAKTTQVCGRLDICSCWVTLAVLVIARGRNGKRYLSSILLVTGPRLYSPSSFCICGDQY